MAYTLNKSIVTKRIIDLLVDFFKAYTMKNRLYRHVDISDRFPLEQVQIPMIVIKSVSNSQRRIHFDDFIDDYESRVKLIPITADNDLFGDNLKQVALPETLDYDPRTPWDVTIGYPSGTDINKTIYRSGSTFSSSINTGIIVTVPGAESFDPTSIVFADEPEYQLLPTVITGTNTYNLAMALVNEPIQGQGQFFLMVSGTDMASGISIPVEPNQIIVDGSGIAPGLTGTRMWMSDVLWAGDQYQLQVTPDKELAFAIYGGIYNMNISLECYARTTIEAEELGDLIERLLVEKKHIFYDKTGVSLTSWSQGGGSEKDYVNEHIFQSSVSLEAFVEWHDYRSVQTITSSEGIAIPSGLYIVNYEAPGIYSYNQFYANGIPTYTSYQRTGNNETQYLYYVSGTGTTGETPISGLIYLSYTGNNTLQQTTGLAFNIAPLALQGQLEVFSNIGSGNVAVQGSSGMGYNITFINSLGNMPLSLIEVSGTGFDSNISPIIVETSRGSAP
jgi:hypothetical protein